MGEDIDAIFAIAAETRDPGDWYLPTGVLGVDLLLGGGWRRGHLVEVTGKERSGKTTIALTTAAAAQAAGIGVAWISPAGSFVTHYARACGVTDELGLINPDNVEETLEILRLLIRRESCGVIVLEDYVRGRRRNECDGQLGYASNYARDRRRAGGTGAATPGHGGACQ